MLSLPIMNHAKLHEWNVIRNTARNSGFPSQLIHNLHWKLTNKCKTQTVDTANDNRTWVTFTFSTPLVHKVTNLFKNTNINTAFKRTNNIYHQLQHRPNRKSSKFSGIYKLQYMTCNKPYVGQGSRTMPSGTRNTLSTYVLTPPHHRMPFKPSTNNMYMVPWTACYSYSSPVAKKISWTVGSLFTLSSYSTWIYWSMNNNRRN
jgi:hypothetical protein